MSIQHRLATPVIQPRMRFFDTDGKPLVGGKVYAFKVGTEEFKPTYRNSELTALNTNPIVLDGVGSALIYLRGANLLKIYDRHGNFIEERIEYQQRERAQFYDDYGRPLKNGYVYTYDYQSTIRKTSYSIDDVINPNPIVLDENGTALVNIVGAYRLRQYNSKNVFVGDQDFKRPPVKALTSRPYPLFFIEEITTGFNVNDSSSRPDPALVGINIPTIESIGAQFTLHDVIARRPPKIELVENVGIELTMHDVISRPLLKYHAQENLSASLALHDVVSKPRIKTNADEAISVSLSINDAIREKI
ncbi:hypothetical protein [Acinetobacter indicus]|uniref:hypothetical protein n=1 Tax=Acinetobacter indicus TaxID=756892 RepID=UPI003988AACD